MIFIKGMFFSVSLFLSGLGHADFWVEGVVEFMDFKTEYLYDYDGDGHLDEYSSVYVHLKEGTTDGSSGWLTCFRRPIISYQSVSPTVFDRYVSLLDSAMKRGAKVKLSGDTDCTKTSKLSVYK